MLIHKARAVSQVFREVETDVRNFKKATHLQCVEGCYKCCLKPDIEATILEFLPAAYVLFKTGKAEELLQRFDSMMENSVCIFCNPFLAAGGCSLYEHRGLICRLFGFGIKFDKNNQPQFISCKKIKSAITGEELAKHISKAPVNSAYYMRLYGIDPKLAVTYYPINEAIRKAVELVLFHNQFRRKRRAS